jgi:hypothetical protein
VALQLQEIKKNEDPRLSFCTPEFKEAQRTFTDAFKVSSKHSPDVQHEVRDEYNSCHV